MSILIRNHAALWRMTVAVLLAVVPPVMAGDGKQKGRSMDADIHGVFSGWHDPAVLYL